MEGEKPPTQDSAKIRSRWLIACVIAYHVVSAAVIASSLLHVGTKEFGDRSIYPLTLCWVGGYPLFALRIVAQIVGRRRFGRGPFTGLSVAVSLALLWPGVAMACWFLVFFNLLAR